MSHSPDPEQRLGEPDPISTTPEPPHRDATNPPSANPGVGATAVLPPKAGGAPLWKGPAVLAAVIVAVFVILLLIF